MYSYCRRSVCRGGVFYNGVPSKMDMPFFSIHGDVYRSKPLLFVVVKAYAFVPTLVVFWCSSVSMILRGGSLAKIFPTVISLVFVFMVHFVLRPFSRHVGPYYSVRKILFVLYAYFYSPLIIQTPGEVSDMNSLRKPYRPPQSSSAAVIHKNFSYELWGKIVVRVFVRHAYFVILEAGIVKRLVHVS